MNNLLRRINIHITEVQHMFLEKIKDTSGIKMAESVRRALDNYKDKIIKADKKKKHE